MSLAQPIVFDNGTAYLRAGLAGEDAPGAAAAAAAAAAPACSAAAAAEMAATTHAGASGPTPLPAMSSNTLEGPRCTSTAARRLACDGGGGGVTLPSPMA